MEENNGYTKEQLNAWEIELTISNIQHAISEEEKEAKKPLAFKIIDLSENGVVYRITVDGIENNKNGYLDENRLKGASATLDGVPNIFIKIHIVTSEEDQLELPLADLYRPYIGQKILIHPKNFLAELRECWADPVWSVKAYECMADLSAPKQVDSLVLAGDALTLLAPSQRPALNLVNYSSSFLWGPPGAGKSRTLAVLLAQYLFSKPQGRVLLVSTTNFAVDDVTLKLDGLLRESGLDADRKLVKRYGRGFDKEKYGELRHLLPDSDDPLQSAGRKKISGDTSLASLSESEFFQDNSRILRPKQVDLASVWSRTRLFSMTITAAIMQLDTLRQLGVFDLIVFDESSQISLAHALAVMPLGKARLFAGDPKQLAPIAKGETEGINKYLAESPFSRMPKVDSPWLCQLMEQYRMAPAINDLVSELFYDGKLQVAESRFSIPRWLSDRLIRFGPIPPKQHVTILNVHPATDDTKNNLPRTRTESALQIIHLILQAQANHFNLRNIIVLTPFVAQMKMIRNRLDDNGLYSVKTSTVHRTQGTEKLVVIFDAVDGTSDFLSTDSARRLINVALSRAQAKLILLFSETDRQNDLLRSISDIVERQQANRRTIPGAD